MSVETQLALLAIHRKALMSGFTSQLVGWELRICTGGTRTRDVKSARRLLGLGSQAHEQVYDKLIWLVVSP